MRTRVEIDLRAGAYGALGAVIGASCMTVVRSSARRFGFIEKTVPQVIEEALTSETRLRAPGARNVHPVLDQLLHLAYGSGLGGIYGAFMGGRRRVAVPSGLGLGLAAWSFGSGIVLPLSRASRGLFHRTVSENAVDVTAHLIFGLATELVRDDLMRHEGSGNVSREDRRRARTG